jgi:hypothetical protein
MDAVERQVLGARNLITQLDDLRTRPGSFPSYSWYQRNPLRCSSAAPLTRSMLPRRR